MKFYGYDFNPGTIHYNSSIRNKADIIKIIIEVARFLNYALPQTASEIVAHLSPDRIRLIIYIDKMSRIFIEETNKIHSFYLPFTLKEDSGKFILSFNGFPITNATCSILTAVFAKISEDSPIDKIIEQYWDVANDLSVPSEENEIYSRLITYLLSFEAGYIRFDHDEIHADAMKHPENHLDINYTGGATFKFGLAQFITYQELIDIININMPCSYLSDSDRR